MHTHKCFNDFTRRKLFRSKRLYQKVLFDGYLMERTLPTPFLLIVESRTPQNGGIPNINLLSSMANPLSSMANPLSSMANPPSSTKKLGSSSSNQGSLLWQTWGDANQIWVVG